MTFEEFVEELSAIEQASDYRTTVDPRSVLVQVGARLHTLLSRLHTEGLTFTPGDPS